MAKKNYHPVSAEVENNPLYHDTYKLLRCYRDSTYSLMVAVRQVEIQFQLEYNTSVDEFLDSIYAAGADLGDSQIEEWAKSIARSNKMIKLLLSSVDLLRNCLLYTSSAPSISPNSVSVQSFLSKVLQRKFFWQIISRFYTAVSVVIHRCLYLLHGLAFWLIPVSYTHL